MAGTKRSHLPSKSPWQIKHIRAAIAAYLCEVCKEPIPNIRAILRCKKPDEVRNLIAKGRHLSTAIYIIQTAERSYCPVCRSYVDLLCKETQGFEPAFYICWRCKTVSKVGEGLVKREEL